jgi:hypothetical protein
VIEVKDARRQFQRVRAVLDNCSQGSFIAQKCLRRLGLRFTPSKIRVRGIKPAAESTSPGFVECRIQPRNKPDKSKTIRDKIPSITDLMGEPTNEEVLDSDTIRKQQGKEREDLARGAKDVDINPGDKVLIQNEIIPNKLTPRFDKQEYVVFRRQGNEITVVGDGKVLLDICCYLYSNCFSRHT